jgi:hypothetical protein
VTGDVATWLVAAAEILAGVLIAGFWLTWFRQPHTEPWLPTGYVEHERVFVFPDTVLAIALVTSAVLLVLEEPLGRSLALLAAGMLTFLGVIDTAYFVQHGMFRRERDGAMNLGLIVGLFTLAAILVVRYA